MERAGCRLVDSDLFVNTYNINKEWFGEVIEYEENPKNKKFYQNAEPQLVKYLMLTIKIKKLERLAGIDG